MLLGAANGAPYISSGESSNMVTSDVAAEEMSRDSLEDPDNADFDPTNCATAPWRSLVIRC